MGIHGMQDRLVQNMDKMEGKFHGMDMPDWCHLPPFRQQSG
jgi:hypothetical protein